MKSFDLLSLAEYGGCSAKLPARALVEALSDLPETLHPNLLVGTETHDDAGVYKITDDIALIQTTDFFPPMCSDPFEFGQIAAANALSDVYAMGGEVLTALNIVAFPTNVPLKVLKEILKGGIEKVKESGGVMAGGHTIVDETPKYGLAVTGKVHPGRIITNSAARPGDVLILTKPIGAGVVMAGRRIGEVGDPEYQVVLESMKQLNREGSRIMQHFNIKCATDITGFGLAGHSLKMAMGSHVTIEIEAQKVPFFEGAYDLIEMGCIPGACFRNLEFVENDCEFGSSLSYNHKMLMMDAQTSGGLLICCNEAEVDSMIDNLVLSGYSKTAVIGRVKEKKEKFILVI